ncbi:hypothetical protein K493DRAFT_343424 [Basidiobolus meristosporus CBS 931.73]|uniref:Uncharacterized protein n=1 Tax=Basidiobolus meristosporus CBS 931.73 TaxID=1314790 RepID=A0A1Y1VR78_9FUNG|nr:hypothetical protein K493DRAFT_343424 [Basidiobolus meristosporus CBS 931.73]|eukprot:ORX63779.1 hypothetical protein K493DRAFT_343424 [Basidiobolus meristosporus CBS 931.73]
MLNRIRASLPTHKFVSLNKSSALPPSFGFPRIHTHIRLLATYSEKNLPSTKDKYSVMEKQKPGNTDQLSVPAQPKTSMPGIKSLRINHKATLEIALRERNAVAAWEAFEELLKIHSVRQVSTLQLSRLLRVLGKRTEGSVEFQNKCHTLLKTMDSLNISFKTPQELFPLILFQYRYGTLQQVQHTFDQISSMEGVPDIYKC